MPKKIQLPKITCKRCGHTWTPRQKVVKMCPNCKSVNFDEKKDEKADE